jgi:hypothetical protein
MPVVETIDTSRMNTAQRAALELTESARDEVRESFAGSLFLGRCEAARLLPFPLQPLEDADQGDAFLHWLKGFLREKVDADAIDCDGEIPRAVIAELARMGAFGIKVPPRYGGLGLSQTNYCRAAMLLGSHCGNLTALLSAHQSIGVPQPLLLFGTAAQKQEYLPRVARGEISAFALTENGAGSDPARMTTTAEPTADGREFILNGEKLWCTNGTEAGVIVVIARTPSRGSRQQTTAFIVETGWPGVEVARRCRFMGLRALYNGVMRFNNVRVPRGNILLGEGRGLKVALSTLNTGRLTLPAACTGLAKRCLREARRWAARREQWGAPIGRHAAIAEKLGRMAADIFAMESMTLFTARQVDMDQRADIRIEAAMAKLWATEAAWRIVNDTLQIRGGRGYETADSQAGRGEIPVPVERWLRDARINTVFEGSSEIMRLFLAREALDPHLRVGGPVLNTKLPWPTRLAAGLRAAVHFGWWYPQQWLPVIGGMGRPMHPVLKRHWRWMTRDGRRLSRALFHAMLRHGPGLEKRQLTLGRLVDIGTELFAQATTLARAEALFNERKQHGIIRVADTFAAQSRLRVAGYFRELHRNADGPGYRLAQRSLAGELDWLEEGIVCAPKNFPCTTAGGRA